VVKQTRLICVIFSLQNIAQAFHRRIFDFEELLAHSRTFLSRQEKGDNSGFDLDVARLEYRLSQLRDKLVQLARSVQGLYGK